MSNSLAVRKSYEGHVISYRFYNSQEKASLMADGVHSARKDSEFVSKPWSAP